MGIAVFMVSCATTQPDHSWFHSHLLEAPLYLDFLPAFISVIYEDEWLLWVFDVFDVLSQENMALMLDESNDGGSPKMVGWPSWKILLKWMDFMSDFSQDWKPTDGIFWWRGTSIVAHAILWYGPKVSDKGKQPHFDDGSLPWNIIHLRYDYVANHEPSISFYPPFVAMLDGKTRSFYIVHTLW